jgi:hypothetical protein
MVVAGFAHRYEPDWMVSDLKENLSWVDGYAAYDDRDNPQVWSPAKQRNQKVFDLALQLGADWVLFTAPDERWSPNTEQVVRTAVDMPTSRRFAFPLREMWTPTEYRVDGVWGTKRRARLTRLGVSTVRTPPIVLDAANIYHLKMIEPENRERRVAVFKAHNNWDNKTRGFDYLADETGLELETVPDHLAYTPAYRSYQFAVPGFE